MDNASNNDTFTKELDKRSQALGIRFRTGYRIRCFAHVLHISVTAILDHLKSKPNNCSEEEYWPEDVEASNTDLSIGNTVLKVKYY